MTTLVRMVLEGGAVVTRPFPSRLAAEWFMAYALAPGYQFGGRRVVSSRLVPLVA